MSGKTAKLIFYGGTLISLVLFLALTVDTHRQVRALTNADHPDDAGAGQQGELDVGQARAEQLPAGLVSHGHLAFFGAYVLLNLMFFYHAMPELKGIPHVAERRGHMGFWWMTIPMLGMGLTFGVAGVLQTYIERIMGLGYMTAQAHMRFWFAVTWVLGLALLFGVILTVTDLLTLRRDTAVEERA